jgi:7-carboxy-7-deazaguanine synthase
MSYIVRRLGIDMEAKGIPVLEIFGPTIQGEGMVIGQKTMFVRTAGCDYSCTWCDSSFTWDGSAKNDIRWMSSREIEQELDKLGTAVCSHVTLSGGNPALIKQLGELIEVLHARGIEIALETQGSRWQDWFMEIDDLTLSPKPPSSNMTTDWTILDSIVQKLTAGKRTFSLKVVVFNDEDLEYARIVHRRYPDASLYLQIGNNDVVEADRDLLQKQLIERYEWLIHCVMISNDFKKVRVLPQLHTWIWGNKRGV